MAEVTIKRQGGPCRQVYWKDGSPGVILEAELNTGDTLVCSSDVLSVLDAREATAFDLAP